MTPIAPHPKLPAPKNARAQFRLRIMQHDEIAIGPGKVQLLEAIAETGSITAAAKRLEMSYRRAWLLVDTLNAALQSPAVISTKGGSSGGVTELTEVGHEIVRRYRAIEAQALSTCATDLRGLMDLLRRLD